jgi:hypothetical protein
MFILPHLKGLLSGNLGSAAFKGAGLDLKFADNKSLVDSISGNSLVSFTRAGSAANAATFVGSDGLLQSAVTNIQLWSEQFDNASWGRTGILAFGSGSVVNAIAAPNGTITADFIVEDTSTGRHRLSPASQSVTNGLTYTCSFYAKSTNRNLFINCDSLFNARSAFNLQTGVVTIGTGSAVIQNIGDGWYRCSVTGTATETKSGAFYAQIQTGTTDANYTGDGTSGIYLWGAQLEQASTVGEYVPTTSVINSAPRFDHNPTTGESLGLLVQEARTNSIFPSADLSSANWTKSNIQVSASTTTAPDGSTCFGYEGSSASSLLKRLRYNFGTTTVGTYTWSIYLKPGTEDSCAITIQDGTGTNGAVASILLTDGTVTGGPSNNGANTGAAVSVQALSNGFYRISLTSTFVAALTQIQAIITWDVNGSSTTTGTIFPWGAQLEAGAFATSYIPTTTATVTRAADVPSIIGANFGTTRTNYIRNNTMVGAVAGTPGTGPTNWGIGAATDLTRTIVGTGIENEINYVDIRYTGTVTAARTQYIFFESSNNIAAVNGQSWTGSVWLKIAAGSLSNISSVTVQADTRDSSVVYVNTPYAANVTPTTTFTRFSGTGTATGTTAWIQPFILFNTATSGLVDITLRIGMPQLELGSVATAVIPTTTAAVSVFESSFYNQTEGTVFAEFGPFGNGGGSKNPGIVQIDSGTAANTIRMFCGGSTSPVLAVDTSSVNQAYISSGTLTPSLTSKITGAYKANDFARAVNGSSLGTDNSGTVPTLSQMLIGTGSAGVTELNGTIKRLTYWPVRLANTTLQQITQP